MKTVDHPLAAANLAVLRSKATASLQFREAMQQISMILLIEAARTWGTADIEVETPLKKCAAQMLDRAIVLVPILRAGLGMVDGMLRLIPAATVGHIGIYRDEEMLRPVTYFSRLPPLRGVQTVLVDPMLATGNSAAAAVASLKKQGADRIQFVCVVSCPPGINQLQSVHPDVEIITAAIDPDLNDFGYIVPGLGDAGDRYFGTGPPV